LVAGVVVVVVVVVVVGTGVADSTHAVETPTTTSPTAAGRA